MVGYRIKLFTLYKARQMKTFLRLITLIFFFLIMALTVMYPVAISVNTRNWMYMFLYFTVPIVIVIEAIMFYLVDKAVDNIF